VDNVSNDALRAMCENVLQLLSTTVDNMDIVSRRLNVSQYWHVCDTVDLAVPCISISMLVMLCFILRMSLGLNKNL